MASGPVLEMSVWLLIRRSNESIRPVPSRILDASSTKVFVAPSAIRAVPATVTA